MGRLYSVNLNDFKAATDKLSKLDLVVICNDWYSSRMGSNFMFIRIYDTEGNLIVTNAFSHYDEDVMYNLCTAWLNRMYDQLKDWK